MKSKTSQLFWTRAGLVLCLRAGGCSDDQLELTPVDELTSSPLDETSVDEGPLIPEVATTAEKPVPNLDPAGVSETPEQAPANALTWDFMKRLRFATEGDDSVLFRFQMTNASSESVTIEKINTSCGCTTADTNGIEGTLMSAFAKEKGGILNDEQIESLVKFLVESPLEPKAPSR